MYIGAMGKARLSAEERRRVIDRFNEEMGRFYEESGTPRIGGRILALLITAEQPLSAEQLAERLSVSRSSISSNVKLLLARGSVEPSTFPGDRLTYYSFSWATWEQRILHVLAGFSRMLGIVQRVMDDLGAADPAYERLVEFERWVRFFIGSYEEMRKGWPKRQRGEREASHE
jgi:DNA-binding transcriptional regulator GbsR (MarR family)